MRSLKVIAGLVALGFVTGAPAPGGESMDAALAQLPCRVGLLTVAMSYAGLQNCLEMADDELEMCKPQAYTMLSTFGKILEDKQCAESYNAFIQQYVVKIDMSRIFKAIIDLSKCSKTEEDMNKCRNDVIDVLQNISKEFQDEVLADASKEWKQIQIDTFESISNLASCTKKAPTMKSTLTGRDFDEMVAKMQPLVEKAMKKLVESINKSFDDLKNMAADSKKSIARQQVLQLAKKKMTIWSQIILKYKVEDEHDLRECSGAWNSTRVNFTALLRSPDTRKVVDSGLDKVPLLYPLRPSLYAFLDTSDKLTNQFFPTMDCLFNWTSVDSLLSCYTTYFDAGNEYASQYVSHLQEVLNSSLTTATGTATPAISLIPNSIHESSLTSTQGLLLVPTSSTSTTTFQTLIEPTITSTSSSTSASLETSEVPVPTETRKGGDSVPPGYNYSRGLNWLSTGMMIVGVTSLGLAIIYGLVILHRRRHELLLFGLPKGGFRRGAQVSEHHIDLDEESLLHELTDTDDDEPLDL